MIRVPGPSSPLEGRSGKVIAVIVIAVMVAIIKPWGTMTSGPGTSSTVPTQAPTPVSAPSRTAVPNYDPDVFGLYEPTPNWELWPAGYLVSFGFATRIEGRHVGSPQPSGSPGIGPPDASAMSSGSPNRPAPSREPSPDPVWPATIRFSSGSHLSLLGINTPLGFAVSSIEVSRTDPDGIQTDVATVRPPSPWPAHFTVVAVDAGNGRDPKESWVPGRYLFDLVFEPGPISRTIEIVIDAPPVPSVAP